MEKQPPASDEPNKLHTELERQTVRSAPVDEITGEPLEDIYLNPQTYIVEPLISEQHMGD